MVKISVVCSKVNVYCVLSMIFHQNIIDIFFGILFALIHLFGLPTLTSRLVDHKNKGINLTIKLYKAVTISK